MKKEIAKSQERNPAAIDALEQRMNAYDQYLASSTVRLENIQADISEIKNDLKQLREEGR